MVTSFDNQLKNIILDCIEMDICDFGECQYADLIATVSDEVGVPVGTVAQEVNRLKQLNYLGVDHGIVTITDLREEENMRDAIIMAGLNTPECEVCGKYVVDCGHMTEELEEKLILDACIEKSK